MKYMITLGMLYLLTSCALGSGAAAVSAYSIQCKTAEGLTAEAENNIIKRVVQELEK